MNSTWFAIAFATFSTAAFAQGADEPIEAQASDRGPIREVYLYKKHDSDPRCDSITITHRSKAIYMGDSPCKNDQVYKFIIVGGLKGDKFVFGADNPKGAANCPLDDWTFTLKATEDLDGDVLVQLKDLKDTKNGQTVGSRYLIMEKNAYDHGSVEGKLSCIQTIPGPNGV